MSSEVTTTPRDPFVKNAILTKHAGGRPAKFTNNLDLIARIEDYFIFCDKRTVQAYIPQAGETVSIPTPAPYTMSGLARYLGVDRGTILNYTRNDEFFSTIRAAKAKIEEDIETRLLEGKNSSGAIFALKNNHGWVDKSEVDNKHEVVQPILGGSAKRLTDENETDTI